MSDSQAFETDIRTYARMIHDMQKPRMEKTGVITTFAGFVAQHGRAFTIDEKTFSLKRGSRHQCYKNAGMMALESPRIQIECNNLAIRFFSEDETLIYVEGFVAVHGVPLEHAWVVTAEGLVRETTVTKKGIDGYFGVPFTSGYVADTVLRTKVWGMLGLHNIKILREPFLSSSTVLFPGDSHEPQNRPHETNQSP
jgi:hypothetical protein